MKLRTKTLVIICLTSCILSITLGVTFDYVVMNGYSDLEKQNVATNVERVLNQIHQDESSIQSVSFDWSVWDESYDFVNDVNQTFIDENLQYDILTPLKINFMIFFNSSGTLVYSAVLNGNSTNDTNLPTSFYSTILRNKDFFFDFTQTGYHTGIVNSNNTYYIVSSTPILHSNNEGASDGTLIVGRYLDANKIQSFENITQLYIEAHPLSNSILKNAEKTLFTSYEKPVYCKPINSSYIAGYSIVDDLQGHPVFILEVGSNRAVYNQGVGMTQNLMIATLFIIAVFIILIILIIDRFVTAPLTKLTNSINEIREYRDLSKKFQAKGNDEIAVLENKIDTMLTWLSKAWMQKDKTELSLEKKVDELERFKKITIDREIRMVELKKQIDDLKSGVRDNREQPPEKA